MSDNQTPPFAISVNGRRTPLKFLGPDQILMIDEALASLNDFGEIVKQYTDQATKQFTNVEFDTYVLMPNHMHMIIIINNPESSLRVQTCRGGVTPPLQRTLGHLVGYYKYLTTKQINIVRNTPGIPLWQRNYYERIIRNDKELYNLRQYIQNNPMQWDNDKDNPIYF